MYVTPTQIALVHATLPRLTRRPAQSAMAFEMHLARYAPALARRMPLSPVALLADAVALIDTPAALLRHVAPLAHTLRAHAMSPRGYMALHAALMDMVSEHLGHDHQLEEAWSDVIGLILATMLAEAHGPRIKAMPLAA
ncbi:globin domain-containing protein [Gymnodinialimonas sp.]